MQAYLGKDIKVRPKQVDGLPSILAKQVESGSNGRSVNINHKDLNTLTKNGFYYGNNLVNAPTLYANVLVVSHSSISNYCWQIVFQQGADNIWVREIVGGTPRAWKKVSLT